MTKKSIKKIVDAYPNIVRIGWTEFQFNPKNGDIYAKKMYGSDKWHIADNVNNYRMEWL